MSYITTDNLNAINAELTNYCNAACPMCARYFIDGTLNKDKVNSVHTTLEWFKEKISVDVVKRLTRFTSCGNFGDGAMNPDCLEIYKWLRQLNPSMVLRLHTNGGARTQSFWSEMAKAGVQVTFAIDGLEDTNHLYRRKVKWQNLMQNVKAYIDSGGSATWAMLIFKHNEMQVDECRTLSQELGFSDFTIQQSARWADYNAQGEWMDLDKIHVDNYYLEKSSLMKAHELGSGGPSQKDLDTMNEFEQDSKKQFSTKKIHCMSCDHKNNNFEIYLAANGDVSPCCWLGDLQQHESKNIIKDYKKVNLNHTSLEEILNGDFFKELDGGIKGDDGFYRLHTCYGMCGVK
jgi:MoaA/NifB/PqqE/SkfB family radical SAM enzyme